MKKRDELLDPTSCLNKARDDEWLFVLMDRDEAFADTVLFWIEKRIELGINRRGDAKLVRARELAEKVRALQAAPKLTTGEKQ